MKFLQNKLLALVCIFFIFSTFSQEVVVKGKAVTWSGETLKIHAPFDPITKIEKELAACKVAETGEFEFRFTLSETTIAYLHLIVFKGIIYLEPAKTYEIIIPQRVEMLAEDRLNPYFEEQEFYVGILNSKPTDLNPSIRSFDDEFHAYLNKNFNIIYRKAYDSKVDTFIQKLEKKYVTINNQYFKNHTKYKYAMLRHLAYERAKSSAANDYLKNQPILYKNTAYTDFFLQIYQNYFTFVSTEPEGEAIPEALIKYKSYTQVKKILSKQKIFSNNDFLEFVVLKALSDAFISQDFDKNAVISVLKDFEKQTTNSFHKEIAQNMLLKFTKLMAGSKAPDFMLQNANSAVASLNDFSGKFVLLNFASLQNYACLKDFRTLKRLYEKYGELLEIVTVITETDFEKAKVYFEKNNYKWTLLSYANQPEIVNNYEVKVLPAYFLIDNNGKLVLSPCPTPNDNLDSLLLGILRNFKREEIRKMYKNE